MLKKIGLLFLYLLSVTLFVSAQDSVDDTGNPNDPTINDNANACYVGASMESKCDTYWEWACGWYLIRFEYDLIPRDEFPIGCSSLLPPEILYENMPAPNPPVSIPTHPSFTFPGTGCIRVDFTYVNFGGGNFVGKGDVTLSGFSDCSFPAPISFAYAYAPEGLAAAEIICQANGAGHAYSFDPTVFECR